jgi:solute carrier family 25 (mitochondrial folate transporter), member 32
MNPLDLLKVKFQVSTRGPEGGIGRGIWLALKDIRANEGWRGFYRGLSPNIAGNASSWGLYFLLCVFAASKPFVFLLLPLMFSSYNQLKRRATLDAPDRPLSASQYLLYSAEASCASFLPSCLLPAPLILPFVFFYLGAVTAILTNPIWVVKVRTFTAPPHSPAAHRGLWGALRSLFV